jgi:hypothetical protein
MSAVSDDYAIARNAIRARISMLLPELVSREARGYAEAH